MFDKIKDFVNNYIKESKNSIIIENEAIYGDNKLEYALSIEEYMASMSILSDLTYDFFATEIESENMLLVKTMHFDDVESLFKQMREDLESFCSLK